MRRKKQPYINGAQSHRRTEIDYLTAAGGSAYSAEVKRAGDRSPVLVVCPPDLLTDDDCKSIRRWKWHLLALMDFDGRPGLDAHLRFTDVSSVVRSECDTAVGRLRDE